MFILINIIWLLQREKYRISNTLLIIWTKYTWTRKFQFSHSNIKILEKNIHLHRHGKKIPLIIFFNVHKTQYYEKRESSIIPLFTLLSWFSINSQGSSRTSKMNWTLGFTWIVYTKLRWKTVGRAGRYEKGFEINGILLIQGSNNARILASRW